jgi:excisionase family DNA binding protein
MSLSLDEMIDQRIAAAVEPLQAEIAALRAAAGPSADATLTVPEAAQLARVGQRVIRTAIHAGELHATASPWRGGSRWLIQAADLRAWDTRRRAALDARRSY